MPCKVGILKVASAVTSLQTVLTSAHGLPVTSPRPGSGDTIVSVRPSGRSKT
jgi:hypothetical protein